jgi:hypothetical protein
MKTWKVTELKFLKNNLESMSRKEMAKRLNRSYPSVNQKINEIGLSKRKKHLWTSIDEKYILDNYKTLADSAMAEFLDLTVSQIKARRKRMGLIKCKAIKKTTRFKGSESRWKSGEFLNWVLDGNS